MHGACTKRLYFYFRSKIWRHHRVLRPRFLKTRENFGNSRTFKADIGLELLNICMGFKTSWSKMGSLGAKQGKGWCDSDPQRTNELLHTFGGSYVCANFGENRLRNATVRVLADGQIHWHTDRLKDANRFLPRCMDCRRGLAMRILSVRLSVCLSVTCVNCDKTVERSVQIYISYERSFSLVFWEEEWLVGATLCTWNFGSTGPRWSKLESLLQSFLVWKLSAAKL